MGKTVLLNTAVADAYYIEGAWIDKLSDLWSRLASQLEIPTNEAGTRTTENSSSWGLSAKLKALFADAAVEVSGSQTKALARGWSKDVPADQAVSAAFGILADSDTNPVIIIDDFHFIPPSVRADVVAALKGICARGATCVLVTLPHHRNEAVSQVQDMIGRSTTVHMREWSIDDLIAIGRAGFESLNLVDDGESIATLLASESYGSPQLMQYLCSMLVADVNAQYHKSEEPYELDHPADWDDFFRSAVEPRSVEWLQKFIAGPAVRGRDRTLYRLTDSRSLDGYKLIFEGLKQQGPELETSYNSLKASILALLDDNTLDNFNRIQLSTKLNHITRIASTSLSALHELDQENEELPSDKNPPQGPSSNFQPLFEYIPDRGGEIHILEPYLAYALKWGSDHLLEEE